MFPQVIRTINEDYFYCQYVDEHIRHHILQCVPGFMRFQIFSTVPLNFSATLDLPRPYRTLNILWFYNNIRKEIIQVTSWTQWKGALGI